MDNNQQQIALINSFYNAFKNKDYQSMAQCYHPDVTFEDPAFKLVGKQVAAMWHMLLSRSKDLTIEFSVEQKGDKVIAHWEPIYTFSQTGRHVHNIIDAEFEFKDGKIIKHTDNFDFWRWSRQALGMSGTLLGWSGFLKGKVQTMAGKSLEQFIEKHQQYR